MVSSAVDQYVTLLFVLKLIFFLLSVAYLVLHVWLHRRREDQMVLRWKSEVEWWFNLLLGALMVYLFWPLRHTPYEIDLETRALFFFFGTIIVVTRIQAWWVASTSRTQTQTQH